MVPQIDGPHHHPHPFTLIRTLTLQVVGLPQKTEVLVTCPMVDLQAQWYRCKPSQPNQLSRSLQAPGPCQTCLSRQTTAELSPGTSGCRRQVISRGALCLAAQDSHL